MTNLHRWYTAKNEAAYCVWCMIFLIMCYLFCATTEFLEKREHGRPLRQK